MGDQQLAASGTISREVVVANSQGLHARPADALAREARKWRSRIELVVDSQRVDGKSILDVLTLAAEAGTRVVIEATGPDASDAIDALGRLFARGFDEHDDTPTGTQQPAAAHPQGHGLPHRGAADG